MPKVLRPDCSLEVVVHPQELLRFRYESDTTKAKLKGADKIGSPAIRVNNYVGSGKLYVCLVTVPDHPGEKPKVHPYRLEGPNATQGFYDKDIKVTKTQNTFELRDICLVRTRKHDKQRAKSGKEPPVDEWAVEIRKRERDGMDPFRGGFDHAENTSEISPSKVALAFQLIVIDDKNRSRPLCRPVASNPVVDTEKKDGLAIVKISPESGFAGKKGVMIVLVSGLESKLDKKDGKWTAKNGDKLEDVLKVRFFSKNNQPKWEAYGNFENRHFHGTEKVCSAIRLAYPRYENPDCTKPHIQVSVELILEHKKGPDTRSDPVCFTYHRKPEEAIRKRAINMKTSENQKFVGAGATGGDVIPMLGGLHSSGQCFSDLSKISDVSYEDKQPPTTISDFQKSSPPHLSQLMSSGISLEQTSRDVQQNTRAQSRSQNISEPLFGDGSLGSRVDILLENFSMPSAGQPLPELDLKSLDLCRDEPVDGQCSNPEGAASAEQSRLQGHNESQNIILANSEHEASYTLQYQAAQRDQQPTTSTDQQMTDFSRQQEVAIHQDHNPMEGDMPFDLLGLFSDDHDLACDEQAEQQYSTQSINMIPSTNFTAQPLDSQNSCYIPQQAPLYGHASNPSAGFLPPNVHNDSTIYQMAGSHQMMQQGDAAPVNVQIPYDAESGFNHHQSVSHTNMEGDYGGMQLSQLPEQVVPHAASVPVHLLPATIGTTPYSAPPAGQTEFDESQQNLMGLDGGWSCDSATRATNHYNYESQQQGSNSRCSLTPHSSYYNPYGGQLSIGQAQSTAAQQCYGAFPPNSYQQQLEAPQPTPRVNMQGQRVTESNPQTFIPNSHTSQSASGIVNSPNKPTAAPRKNKNKRTCVAESPMFRAGNDGNFDSDSPQNMAHGSLGVVTSQQNMISANQFSQSSLDHEFSGGQGDIPSLRLPHPTNESNNYADGEIENLLGIQLHNGESSDSGPNSLGKVMVQ